jgi:hypothetical protein
MKQISVYIASPYTKPEGSQLNNTIKSFKAYNELLKYGFFPFAPLSSHYIHEQFPQTYDTWLKIDFYWLDKCDCLLRLPGESVGADKELNRMVMAGKPVFYNINDLVKYYGGVL